MMARKEHATSRVGHHVQVLVVVCPAATAAPLSTERAWGVRDRCLQLRVFEIAQSYNYPASFVVCEGGYLGVCTLLIKIFDMHIF